MWEWTSVSEFILSTKYQFSGLWHIRQYAGMPWAEIFRQVSCLVPCWLILPFILSGKSFLSLELKIMIKNCEGRLTATHSAEFPHRAPNSSPERRQAVPYMVTYPEIICSFSGAVWHPHGDLLSGRLIHFFRLVRLGG